MEPPPPLHHDPRAGDPRSADPQRAGDSPWRRTQRHARPEGAGWPPAAPEGAGWAPEAPAPAGHGAGPGPGEYRGGDPEPYRQPDEGDYDTGGRFVPGFGDYAEEDYHAEPPRRGRGARGRSAPPPGPPRRPRRRRFRWIAPLAALAVILIPVAIGGAYVYSFYMSKYHPADYSGPGTGRVVVQVPSGATPTSLGPELTKLGVVASARAFVLAAEHSSNQDGSAARLLRRAPAHAGPQAYALLINPKNLVQVTVTIPEGWRLSQIVAYLGAKSGIPAANYEKVLKDPAKLSLPAYAGGKAEGYLFPATYEVQPARDRARRAGRHGPAVRPGGGGGQPARGRQAGPPDRRPGHHHGQPGRSRGGPDLGLPEDRPGDLQPAGAGHPAAAGQHGAVRAEHLRHHRQRRRSSTAPRRTTPTGTRASRRGRSTARGTPRSRPC